MAVPYRRIKCDAHGLRSGVSVGGWGEMGRIGLTSITVTAGMDIGPAELRELAAAALARAMEVEDEREENH